MNISYLLVKYKEYLVHTYTSNTSTTYLQGIYHFLEFHKEEFNTNPEFDTLKALSKESIDQYHQYVKQTASVETEHLYTRVLIHFLDYHADLLEIDLDLVREEVSTNRRKKPHLVPDLPITQIEKVLSYIADITLPPLDDETYRDRLRIERNCCFFLVLATTGLRLSEACDLREADFSEKARSLTIEKTHMVILSHYLTSLIKKYLAERKLYYHSSFTNSHLFIRHDKRISNNIAGISRWTGANIIQDLVDEALQGQGGSDKSCVITANTLRHYFVFKALSESRNLEVAQEKARHEDPSTTRRYKKFISDWK